MVQKLIKWQGALRPHETHQQTLNDTQQTHYVGYMNSKVFINNGTSAYLLRCSLFLVLTLQIWFKKQKHRTKKM